MKRKYLSGIDGLNGYFEFDIDSLKDVCIPAKKQENMNGETAIEISVNKGKMTLYVNLPRIIRTDNMMPFSLSDVIHLNVVFEYISDFIKNYLEENGILEKYPHGKILNGIRVSKIEMNLTNEVYGNCKISDVISLFDAALHNKSADNILFRRQGQQYRKENTAFLYTKPHEYKVKIYDKSLQQQRAGNNVKDGIMRIEIIFLERTLQSLFCAHCGIFDIISQTNLLRLCRKYAEILDNVINKQVKRCLNESVELLFESLTYSDTSREIDETVARHKEIIFDVIVLKKALQKWYKFRNMPDYSKQAIYRVQQKYNLPTDTLKTVKMFHELSGAKK